jgi:uncharacterized protein (TIGR02996 family)
VEVSNWEMAVLVAALAVVWPLTIWFMVRLYKLLVAGPDASAAAAFYADWLEDHGEQRAADKLRQAFGRPPQAGPPSGKGRG